MKLERKRTPGTPVDILLTPLLKFLLTDIDPLRYFSSKRLSWNYFRMICLSKFFLQISFRRKDENSLSRFLFITNRFSFLFIPFSFSSFFIFFRSKIFQCIERIEWFYIRIVEIAWELDLRSDLCSFFSKISITIIIDNCLTVSGDCEYVREKTKKCNTICDFFYLVL